MHRLILSCCCIVAVLLVATVLVAEPALAGNKFEKISGGVTGSSAEKRQFVTIILASFGGLMLLGSALAAILPHNNPLYLNYANWKASAILMLIFGLVLIGLSIAV